MARKKISLWKFGGLSPLKLLRRVYTKIDEDRIWGHSAELSYYFLFALFPALLFMVSLLGIFAAPGTAVHASLFNYMARVLPSSSTQLVQKTLSEVHQSSGGGKLAFGILSALWAASSGVSAICTTLNVAYHVKETRPWWKQKTVAIGLTLALAVIVIVALTLILFGEKIADFIAAHVGFGSVFTITWKIAQWPVAGGFMLLAFALIYYFAPNVKEPEWYWVTPGAVTGFVLWFLSSLGFRVYLKYFNNYSATYGSLGAVIILMLWFYLSGAAVLMGGEVNSQIGEAGEAAAKLETKLKELDIPVEEYGVTKDIAA
jgi:membrane protein